MVENCRLCRIFLLQVFVKTNSFIYCVYKYGLQDYNGMYLWSEYVLIKQETIKQLSRLICAHVN